MEPVNGFDRAHTLSDLLAVSVLRDLADDPAVSGPLAFAVLDESGQWYFQGNGADRSFCEAALERLPPRRGTAVDCGAEDDRGIFIYPLELNFEILGHLVAAATDASRVTPCLEGLASLLARRIGDAINYAYKYRLTAGLHGEVVRQSYDDLMVKHRQLEESEARLRRFSRDLESEVEKKTAQIERARLGLIQQEKLASVGRLAAGVAHEINTPLGFVRSNIGVLGEYLTELSQHRQAGKNHGEPPAKGMDPIKDIFTDAADLIDESLEGIDRITTIVANLKAFSAIDNPGKSRIDPNRAMDRVLAALADEIGDGARVVRQYGATPPITCFQGLINQALMNIVQNALQAAGSAGTVWIRTGPAQSGPDRIQIDIQDDGPGILPEHLSRAFDPFFTTRDIGRGVGLGLSVAQSIVQHHGGVIEIDSQPGQGTRVRLVLPVEMEDRPCPD